jgi:hypothetical protein
MGSPRGEDNRGNDSGSRALSAHGQRGSHFSASVRIFQRASAAHMTTSRQQHRQQGNNLVRENNHGWRIGQLIQVTCLNSRHFGRCGVITQVCNVRLRVAFEDGEPGSFVAKSRASLVAELPRAARTARRPWERPWEVESDEDEDGATDQSQLLEHLAFTAAALISSHGDDAARIRRTLNKFTATVCRNTRALSRQRRWRPRPLPYAIAWV